MSTERPVIAQVDERPEYRGRSTDARTTPPSRLHFGRACPTCLGCGSEMGQACRACGGTGVAQRGAQAAGGAADAPADGEAPAPACTCLLNRPEACQRHPVGDCGCAVCVVARRAQAGARAAGAAAEGEAPTNAWRPIESARPRNGERVVVWDGDMRVATWRASDAFWELDEGGICDPSLWLPTPSVWMVR